MPPVGHRVVRSLALTLALAACGGTTVASFSSEQAAADGYLEAELSADADSAALADEYAGDPAAGLVRGGGTPSQLLVFLEPGATDEQISALEDRLRREQGVLAVSLRRGVEPPPLVIEVPPPPAR